MTHAYHVLHTHRAVFVLVPVRHAMSAEAALRVLPAWLWAPIHAKAGVCCCDLCIAAETLLRRRGLPTI